MRKRPPFPPFTKFEMPRFKNVFPDAIASLFVESMPPPTRKVFFIDIDEVIGVDLSRFPHLCPRCGAAAYIGFDSVDCSRRCK